MAFQSGWGGYPEFIQVYVPGPGGGPRMLPRCQECGDCPAGSAHKLTCRRHLEGALKRRAEPSQDVAARLPDGSGFFTAEMASPAPNYTPWVLGGLGVAASALVFFFLRGAGKPCGGKPPVLTTTSGPASLPAACQQALQAASLGQGPPVVVATPNSPQSKTWIVSPTLGPNQGPVPRVA